jgi:hypothetical protein
MYQQISATVSHQFNIPEIKKSSTSSHGFVTSAEKIVNNLSFSHIRGIMVIVVSTHMLHLPEKTLLDEFMRKEIKGFEDKE